MLYCLRDVSIQYEKDTYDKTIVLYKMNESFNLNLKALCRIIFDLKRPYISGILCKGLTYLLFW